MDFDTSMKISGSGLKAHRAWMSVVSANLANVNTTRTASGKAYERRTILYESSPPTGEAFGASLEGEMRQELNGVKVVAIVPDRRDFRLMYDPSHPDADADGNVKMPNINPVEEMSNLLIATRSYEANLAALNMSKQLALKAIEIGK